MNRVEIKEEAKKLAFNNKWYLWKPMIFFSLLLGLCTGLLGGIAGAIGGDISKILTVIISILSGLAGAVYGVGYTHYVLEFVRGNRFDWKETIEFSKKHWLVALLVSLIVGVIVSVGSALLIIPGVIAAIGLTFYEEVTVDNTDMKQIMAAVKTESTYYANKLIASSKRFGRDRLARAIELCAQADLDLKGFSSSDPDRLSDLLVGLASIS